MSIDALHASKTVEDMFDLAAPAVKKVVARLLSNSEGGLALDICEDIPTLVLGRSKDLPEGQRLASGRLSTFHCEFHLELPSNIVYVVDKSTNGTFVNSERLTKNEKKELSQGDSISLVNPSVASAEETKLYCFVFQRIIPTRKTDSLTEELTCGVCRGVFYRPVSCLPCLHTFCGHCISSWLMKQGVCPQCRVPIKELRPSHTITSLVDHLLAADPTLKYSEEEKAEFDKQNTVPPTGKKIHGASKRTRSEDGGADDGGGYVDSDEYDDDDDDGSDGSDDSGLSFGFGGGDIHFHTGVAPVGGLTMMLHPPAPAACPQCSTPSADGFQCPAGQIHVSCHLCKQPFPSRPLCDIPQRCEICNVAFCDLYLGGCKNPSGVGYMQPLEDFTLDFLPKGNLFSGNNIEITILEKYLDQAGINVKTVWEQCVAHFKDGSWQPAMTTIKGELKSTSVCCKACCQRVFARLLFHFRRSIPRDALPPAVTARADCWFGLNCRTQKHNSMHAQNYNHICDQVKRKE